MVRAVWPWPPWSREPGAALVRVGREGHERLPGGIQRNCPGARQHPGLCDELRLAGEGQEGPSGLMPGKAAGSPAALVNPTPSREMGEMKEEGWERSARKESQEPRRGEEERGAPVGAWKGANRGGGKKAKERTV